jgi:hypothetical protein
VIDDAAWRLAQAFVECTTEYDFAEIPDDVKVKLVEAATAVLAYTRPEIIVIREGQQP